MVGSQVEKKCFIKYNLFLNSRYILKRADTGNLSVQGILEVKRKKAQYG
jgi:hypothetical protein